MLRWLAKFPLKHGPGSIGRTAKVMTIAANNLYHAYDYEKVDDLLRAVVNQRFALVAIVSQQAQDDIVQRALAFDGRIRFAMLIYYCWSAVAGCPIMPFSMYDLAHDVIDEQVDKFLTPELAAFLEPEPM